MAASLCLFVVCSFANLVQHGVSGVLFWEIAVKCSLNTQTVGVNLDCEYFVHAFLQHVLWLCFLINSPILERDQPLCYNFVHYLNACTDVIWIPLGGGFLRKPYLWWFKELLNMSQYNVCAYRKKKNLTLHSQGRKCLYVDKCTLLNFNQDGKQTRIPG